MTSELRVCVISPGRTSSGGSAFARSLLPELANVLGTPVTGGSVPPIGRLKLPSEVVGATHVVFLGSRAVRVDGASTVFWPLNVAPLEQHVVNMANTSARNWARHRLLKRRLERSASLADGLVFGSFHARTLYMAAFAKAAKKPYIVNRGGTPSLAMPSKSGTGSSPSRRLVLLVSHLYPYKGILEFVEAVGRAHNDLPDDVEFRIAGADRDPRYAAKVHARVAELGLKGRLLVREAPPDEMAGLYARASLAVFASTCENAGSFALYDGLHAGVPTLCSDRSSMPEMVGSAVQLFNPFDSRAFSTSMLELLADAPRRGVLASKAREWSRAAPTWRLRAEELAAFLRNVGVNR